MSKIICDICGTSYPETAEQCPICGCARDLSAESLADELVEEEVTASAAPRAKGGRFAAANVRKRGKTRYEEPGYDEDDEEEEEDEYDEDDDYYESDYDDDDDEDEEEHKSNAPLVVLLVVVIAALLAVTGFIFVKYFMPNMMAEETTEPETVQTTAAPETTVPTVPCTDLAMTSGGSVELNEAGQNWLINVMVLPEDTTDVLVYMSSDESVVTVNEQGKLTAVGEGNAVITITCGEKSLECYVTCNFVPETTVPETTAPEDETTAPEETTEPLKDVTLKVSLTDITFNAPNQGYTFKVNGLSNTEVKWTSEDESIVKVDENGVVTSVGPGNTKIICQYGEQKVEITIRCKW